MAYPVVLTGKAKADVESALKWIHNQQATDVGGPAGSLSFWQSWKRLRAILSDVPWLPNGSKSARESASGCLEQRKEMNHPRDVVMSSNFALIASPTDFAPAIIVIAINDAINAYSIAVAPFSSAKNRDTGRRFLYILGIFDSFNIATHNLNSGYTAILVDSTVFYHLRLLGHN